MTEILHTAFDTVLIILMALAAVMVVIFTVAIVRAAWQTITAKKPVPNFDDKPTYESVTKTVTKTTVKKPAVKKVAKKKAK